MSFPEANLSQHSSNSLHVSDAWKFTARIIMSAESLGYGFWDPAVRKEESEQIPSLPTRKKNGAISTYYLTIFEQELFEIGIFQPS